MEQVQQRVLKAQVSSTPCLALFWALWAQGGQCKGATDHHRLIILWGAWGGSVVTVWWEGGPSSLSCCLYPSCLPCSVSSKGRASSQPLSYCVANRVVLLQVR